MTTSVHVGLQSSIVESISIDNDWASCASTFTYQKSWKHVEYIKNVIISKLIKLYTYMLETKKKQFQFPLKSGIEYRKVPYIGNIKTKLIKTKKQLN